MSRCIWCRDPVRDLEFEPFCSTHCKAQQRCHWKKLPTSAEAWDGVERYAVQLPLPLRWRMSCLLCGRDRWLFKPLEEIRHMHRQACPTCQGFQLVELDYGLARPGLEWVA